MYVADAPSVSASVSADSVASGSGRRIDTATRTPSERAYSCQPAPGADGASQVVTPRAARSSSGPSACSFQYAVTSVASPIAGLVPRANLPSPLIRNNRSSCLPSANAASSTDPKSSGQASQSPRLKKPPNWTFAAPRPSVIVVPSNSSSPADSGGDTGAAQIGIVGALVRQRPRAFTRTDNAKPTSASTGA